jgi:hypothetical protein
MTALSWAWLVLFLVYTAVALPLLVFAVAMVVT